MNYEMVDRLVRKEWYFSRLPIAFLFGAGVVMLIALAIAVNTEAHFLRFLFFLLLFIVFNFMFWLPVATVLSERTEQTLAFLVSLPVTIKEYSAAKIVANVGIFLVPWLLLSGGLLGLILATDTVPNAYALVAIIVLLQALVLNCVMMAVALVSESPAATMATGVIGNIVFWFSFGLIGVAPGTGMGDPVAAWDKLWWMLPAEAAAIPVILGLAIYLQSRKTDFIR